jgi:hypothetical protein
MPKYTFKLWDDDGGVEDDIGVTLPDADIAFKYGCEVVSEMMNCRERRTRSWQLDVYEDDHKKVFEIPFAALDRTLDHLNAVMRQPVQEGARQTQSVKDTQQAARIAVRETKSPVARSRGKPSLAADRGRKVVRDFR